VILAVQWSQPIAERPVVALIERLCQTRAAMASTCWATRLLATARSGRAAL